MSKEPKDILLEDYRHLSGSIARNEQTGETRVNLFVGLIAIVIGALASVVKDSGGQKSSIAIVSIGLLLLLTVGIATLLRIIKRNASTDRDVMRLDYIRQTFKDHFDDDGLLTSYDPFRTPFAPGQWQKSDTGKANIRPRLRGFHGLTLTVALMNSFLCSLLCAAIFVLLRYSSMPPRNDYFGITIGSALAFAAAVLVQRAYVHRKERQSKQQPAGEKPTHAGGVVFEIRDGPPQFALIQPSGESCGTKWVLPKGHIEKCLETDGEAALREVREECGIDGQLGCLLDRIEFKKGEDVQDVKFYLIEKRYDVHPEENRGVRWFSFEEAMEKLSYPESRYLLAKANTLLLRRQSLRKLPG
jgi:8-oxo-dGTP pyrophosphatase MutT (NUDIX family)